MEYLGERIYRGFKFTTAIVGALACGVIIITSAIGIKTIVIPVCGGIALIPMGFIFFNDHKVIKDMEKLVTKFKAEFNDLKKINEDITQNNVEFSNNNKTLASQVETLHAETGKLESMLKLANDQITKLTELNRDYEYNNNKLKSLLDDAEVTTKELTLTTESLVEIKEKYSNENSELKITATHIEMQLKELLKANENYKNNLKVLESHNKNLDEKLVQLEISYDKAKETVKTLLMAAGILQDLGDDMVETQKKTSENATLTGKLLNMFGIKRTQKLFDKLDQNEDGVISNEEFLNILIHADE